MMRKTVLYALSLLEIIIIIVSTKISISQAQKEKIW